MGEPAKESVREVTGVHLLDTVAGLLVGFGVAYLVCYLIDAYAEPPMYFWSLFDFLLPFAILGMIILLHLIRKPSSIRDALGFVFYFWVPFLFLYLVTHYIYWAPKIG